MKCPAMSDGNTNVWTYEVHKSHSAQYISNRHVAVECHQEILCHPKVGLCYIRGHVPWQQGLLSLLKPEHHELQTIIHTVTSCIRNCSWYLFSSRKLLLYFQQLSELPMWQPWGKISKVASLLSFECHSVQHCGSCPLYINKKLFLQPQNPQSTVLKTVAVIRTLILLVFCFREKEIPGDRSLKEVSCWDSHCRHRITFPIPLLLCLTSHCPNSE